MNEIGVDRLLARMRRKQAECDGDRSHKDLRELDELKTALSYDGWRLDADEAEKHHARYGEASDMLDALTPTLSYDGWEKDARIIECAGGNGSFEGLGMNEIGVDRLLARMRRKQAECDGDRSHKD